MKSDHMIQYRMRAAIPRRAAGIRRFAVSAAAFCSLLSGAAFEAGAQTAPPVNSPNASPTPVGIWFDDTGQGAIEIAPCGVMLCGRIVWLKEPTDENGRPLTDALNPDPRNRQRPICGLQIIGDLKPQPDGTWDEGWIYDPKEGKSYDVEIRLRAPDRLQIKGYLGVKFLSESFIWQRAPAELPRCTA